MAQESVTSSEVDNSKNYTFATVSELVKHVSFSDVETIYFKKDGKWRTVKELLQKLPKSGTTSYVWTKLWPAASMTIDLNGNQWNASGTASNGNTIYKSQNAGIHNSQYSMYFRFEGYSTIEIYARSNGESNYDYLWIGDLDSNSLSDSTHKVTTKGSPSTSFTKYTWTVSDKGSHFIKLTYKKDSSANNNEDAAFCYLGNCS